MPVPYTFGTATAAIPLSNLDANFNTPVTIGNTTVGLGNTVTTLGNVTLTNATISSGNVTVSSISDSGNLTFTGTGNRITGDFNNATLTNRVAFQTSTTNGNTIVGLLPNGTATAAAVHVYGASDPTNTSRMDLVNAGTDVRLASSITGTGTYLPMTFLTGGSERLRIDTSGNVGIGTSSPSSQFVVSNGGAVGFEVNPTGTASAPVIFAYNRSTSAYTQLSYSGLLHVWDTSGTERMRIDSNGNVGIGTSSPASGYALTLQNNSAQLRIRNTTTRYRSDFSVSSGGLNINSYDDTGSVYLPVGLEGSYVYFNTSGGERMRIDSSGNVGIGTTSIGQKMVIAGATDTRVQVDGSSSGGIYFTQSGSDAGTISGTTSRMAFFAGGYGEAMRITSGGEVYIAGTTDQGAYNLQCNGTGVWGAGAYVNGSDKRIKDNIAPIDSGLDVVTKLNPVTYKYKEDWSKDQSTQTGFIAQELLTALEGKNYIDGVVQQGGEYMSVAYQNIIPILAKAIQEQQAMIEELKQEVAKLKGAK